MDKKIWLRVIREELELLDVLATEMIDDKKLSKEEVELAISRSKIVAKEFEMLLNQITGPVHQEEKVAEVETPAKAAEEEIIFQMPIPEYNIAEIESESPPEGQNDALIQIDGPRVSQSPGPLGTESPGSLVTPSPPPFQASQEPEENSALHLEHKSEEYTRFKPAPIKSLKEGLILNDRYLFQRELFNNDKAQLDETVAALDRLASIQEAVEYLKANFRWTKSEASEKFVLLVKRRFS
ncbi:MAG: hypothetical protein M0Q53_14420 [Prolixibacteraceae bacterium]|jgi:hypothetical protein|nr:hypothetical protein [Prolixibacteraceae bacterium]